MAQSPTSLRVVGNETRRVLVLDDDEAIARLIRRTLEPRGWSVVHVPDGLRAFEQLDALPFRAVIADQNLPAGPGGAKVLERVRRLYMGVRLIWLSGYVPSDETAAILRRIGATVLPKGATFPSDIIAAVEGPPDAA